MALGLRLAGTLPPASDRDRLGRWLVRRFPGAPVERGESPDGPALSASLHPAAPPISLRWPAPDRLLVEASTSAAGPGYHAHVVDLLDDLARQFAIAWDPPDPAGETGDETGYFVSRDAAALEGAMLGWLRAAAAIVARTPTACDVGLPLSPTYLAPAPSRTALGPREASFWADVAAGRRDGREFFPWFARGQGAAYHRGVALSLLWCEVRWRPPVTDAERATLRRVHDELVGARALEPDGPLPLGAWAEVLGLLEERGPVADEVRALAAAAPPAPPVGWRRHPVRVGLGGGWSLVVPGHFAEEWQEETFSAWGDRKTVWFTAFQVDGDEPSLAALREGVAGEDAVEVHVREEAGLRAAAALAPSEEEGAPLWLLRTRTARGGRIALCTLALHDRADVGWALETWRTIRGPRPDASSQPPR